MKKKVKLGTWVYNLLAPLIRLIFRIWYNPTIVGKEYIPKEGPIIIASNHKHCLDQCLAIMSTKRVVYYMVDKECFDGKLAFLFKLLGCIPIDVENEDASKEIAVEVLNNKGVIGVFPEGIRNNTFDKLLLPLKDDSVLMSYETGAYIIPCAITGDYCFRSKNLIISFGIPFRVDDDNYVKYNEILREDIERLIKENLNNTNRTIDDELQSRY